MPVTDVAFYCPDTSSYNCFLRKLSRGLAPLLLFVAGPSGALAAAPAELEEIIVTASLRPEPIGRVPVSTTVLDSATLRAAGLQHFADVLGLVPNLNWAGGTSRPRFFQLRGIGELEQYQGAPNPSVGFSDRRDRLQRRRHAGDAVRCRSRSRCCAGRRVRATAPTRWQASSSSTRAMPNRCSRCRHRR